MQNNSAAMLAVFAVDRNVNRYDDHNILFSINKYLKMNAVSVGKGQDFGIKSIVVSVYSPRSIDQSRLSGVGLHAGK